MRFWHNDGQVVEKPFRKFEASYSLGRNHFYSVFLPIIGDVAIVEESADSNKLIPINFRVVQSKKSQHFLIVPDPENREPNTILAFIGDSAGFRGSTGLVEKDTTAKVLYVKSTHAACSGNVTSIAVLRVGERVVTFSDGRRNNDVTVFENIAGDIVRTVYKKSEYEIMVSPDGVASEDWAEV